MGLTKFPNGVSSFGMPVLGAGGVMTTGSVWFVSSVTGSNGNSGTDPDHPFATADYAVGRCTANKGDVIFLMPNHAEALAAAAALDLDVAGITLIGLGSGDDRATFTLGTTEAADVDIDANNITIQNVVFDLTGIDAVAAGIDVNSSYFAMDNCEVVMSDASGQCTVAVAIADSAHAMRLTNNAFIGTTDAGVASGLDFTGISNDTVIKDNFFEGSFSVAAITASGACLRMRIEGNVIGNNLATKPCMTMGSATGNVTDNRLGCGDTNATSFIQTADSMWHAENYMVPMTFGSLSGILIPTVYTTSDVRLKNSVVYM